MRPIHIPEIKFRGRARGNQPNIKRNQWVYGFYASKHNNQPMGRRTEYYILEPTYGDWGFSSFREIQVYPETVGQYTGLKDIHSKDIYVHDVIKNQGKQVVLTSLSEVHYMIIECTLFNQEAEVIGNMFDNPELFPR